MKFFHLSDLHIGKQLHAFSLLEEQRYMLEQVLRLAEAEQPDCILIAGDIYDKPVPSTEAVALLDWFLAELAKKELPVLMVSGNHDSSRRLSFASALLERAKVYIAGEPPRTAEDFIDKVVLQDEWGPVNFYLLPFVKPGYVAGVFPGGAPASYEEAVRALLEREALKKEERNVLVTHQFYTAGGQKPQRSDSEVVQVGGLDQVDVSVLSPFCYGALGHIHRAQKIGEGRFRYCGTLFPYSAGEGGDAKSLTVVTLREPQTAPVIEKRPMPLLRRVREERGTLSELLEKVGEGICEDYVSLTLTDERMPYQPREALEKKYERILELKVDNQRTRRQAQEIRDCVLCRDPMELFAGFYYEMQGEALDPGQKKLMENLLEEIREEEK